MIRKAFVMQVYAGQESDYEKRHNPIWQELESTLKAHGAHRYSIFLHPETRQLFGYVEIEDENRWNAIASTAICRKWWIHMKPLMETHADASPVSLALREVFHMD
ncbi:MAG: L-rhamnose mutarotase [Lentisphaerae bacterium RIFOXYC12_FULL_60_16]|nr:MAG: L-rhamnose mutarotase [Lentisphaerae bacterium RIFOXYC12_FULL_60_16]OGV74874.1 MAG: L-rhamnose mutarotase [Lentisphaerae bacterium RIFOXYA12_FULL_60_10]OGV76281.1 MAG: L-rhamnose mutarotase [Lentisphaerae bacterium RIFOXYB12_FULL_60_10]